MINGRTRLHVVANGTMTGQRYIDEVLLPHVRLFRGAVGDKFVFMDDNATYLNPIENVWDALGRQVTGRNYPPANNNTLIRALTEEWDKLPQQLLDNVVQSIFDAKDAPCTGRPVVENFDNITEIIEVDRHELLPHDQTLNSDLCCQQLDHLKLAIDQKWSELTNRRGAVFHQDNTRPHTSIVTRQNLWEFVWKVLMHPPYSPDPTPSDYHLLALQNFLSDKKWGSRKDCENRLLDGFTNKGQDFYERGIMKLPLKFQHIIQQNGAYLI
ncbi:transposase [Trichonephila clavipes]|nr:transposase [Trichonephila clavipes]